MAYMDTEYPGGLLMQKLGEAVRYDSWTLTLFQTKISDLTYSI